MAEEKTEEPTHKKTQENRKEGRIPRTPDLGGWASTLVAGLVLTWVIPHIGGSLRSLMVHAMVVVDDPDPDRAVALLASGLWSALVISLLIGGVLFVVMLISSVAQGGVHLASKAAQPKLKRLNPIEGFKRILGVKAWWEGLKVLLKTTVVALLVWRAVDDVMESLGGLVPLHTGLTILGQSVAALMRDVAVVGLLLAGIDYLVQRRQMRKQTYMTKDEVKQENKSAEGDPHLKGARRSRQLSMSRNRMMAAVAEADVVVVNPVHYAVALRYQPERGAPRVVAKGAGAVAARIREKAVEHRVATVEDIPLARALHGSCEIGQEVPAPLFEAVAHVLAFVLTLRTRGHASGHHRSPRPHGDLPKVPRGRHRQSPPRQSPQGQSAPDQSPPRRSPQVAAVRTDEDTARMAT